MMRSRIGFPVTTIVVATDYLRPSAGLTATSQYFAGNIIIAEADLSPVVLRERADIGRASSPNARENLA